MKLNLGCGEHKLAGYVNVDSEFMVRPDVCADLGKKWPWPDNSVDEAMCSHILEHLPGETFFFFMRELYRVCKNGAVVHLILPHPRHDIFLNDPTHCRVVMPATMIMFSRRYIDTMRERGLFFTDFGRRTGVDFDLDQKIVYAFDDWVKAEKRKPEELDHLARTQNNVIKEWRGKMRAVKPE